MYLWHNYMQCHIFPVLFFFLGKLHLPDVHILNLLHVIWTYCLLDIFCHMMSKIVIDRTSPSSTLSVLGLVTKR